ncbi:MarR family transcriptional regulator [Kribbella sp. NPDC023972]|uniref:MarR family winged helix-turn-helix transcriptional regulator n=1 Tax=Kribbella sp. NPDC023972 TaxID=3154795 RepID=UPI0034038B07
MLSDRLGYLLKHVQARLTEEQAKALEPFGINGRDLAVLSTVASEEPLSQLEVAARLGVDRTSIGDLLDALEDRGLIERRRSPADRRRNIVALTPHGEDTLEKAEEVRIKVEQAFLAPLTSSRRFREDLRKLLDAD